MIEFRCPCGHLIFKYDLKIKGEVSGEIEYYCFRCRKVYSDFMIKRTK